MEGNSTGSRSALPDSSSDTDDEDSSEPLSAPTGGSFYTFPNEIKPRLELFFFFAQFLR